MIAADTNIVVRLITRDDAAQTKAAQDLLLARGLYLSLGVLMECEWVLRGGYRWPRARIGAALSALTQLEGVTPERAEGVRWALDRHAAGGDLADMLHIVAANGADGFATFDRKIAAAAGNASPVPVETL